MKNPAAQQLAQDWLELLGHRWENVAPGLSRSLSTQNKMAAGLERHLLRFAPDGEGFAFHSDGERAPRAAVLTDDDALYEVAVSNFDQEGMHITFRARR